jgi:hypothetical protein
MRWLGAPARLRGRGWAWLVVYLLGCAAILGLAGGWILRHEDDLVGWIASYVVRDSWRPAAELVVEQLLATQQKEILVNAVVSASLVLVSLLLFPVKEKLSGTFEREARLTGGDGGGFPLLFEAGEEVKLFLWFVAAQTTIFWIGYPPDPTTRAIALVASYLVLAASFAMDFITPILSRHRVRFSTAAKALARRPHRALLFGATFAFPAALAGGLAARQGDWGVGRTIAVIFAVNVVCFAWGAVSGTALGAELLPVAQTTRRPSAAVRVLAWLLLVGLLAWNGYRFGAVAVAVHRKSAILKCEYDVDWGSVKVDTPGLLGAVAGLKRDQVTVGIALEVTVVNPTERTLEIEDNRVELAHHGKVVARSALPVFRVAPGGRATVPASFRVTLAPSALLAGRALLSEKEWDLTLYVAAAPGFELPVYVF